MGFFRDAMRWLSVSSQTNRVGKPYDNRLWFINDDDEIRKRKLQEYLIWYSGDSDELLNYYTRGNFREFQTDPIFNRNKKDYFWSVASMEEKVKRTHSGIPRAIVETITNAIGNPMISSDDPLIQQRIDDIIKANDLYTAVNQEQMPLTLVTGGGAWKINIDTNISDKPILTFYDVRNVRFEIISRRIMGIKFVDYYKGEDNKAYALVDHRFVDDGNSYVEYKLYKLRPGQKDGEYEKDGEEVALTSLPQTKDLQDTEIVGLTEILGVPSIFFKDTIYEGYGRSIYSGKVDLFDDLDQALSQSANTVRKSTPVEYFPVDMLERTPTGEPKLPARYDRTYVATPAGRNGDGDRVSQINTTQPSVNFAQYSGEELTLLSFILTGVLSPATMGIDVAKKDNADAQREKEKVTIMTRNNIILKQKEILDKVLCLALKMENYMMDPTLTEFPEYQIGVDFEEFANPSFENQIVILANALSSGAISIDRYVDLLWGDSLDEAAKQAEVEYIKQFMGQGGNPLDALLGATQPQEQAQSDEEEFLAAETGQV
jgi:hypothetical protein